MKTKNIFKTLVLAAVLVSACGKNEIADDFKGYTLPVTINVTRQGDEPATRATYNESTRKLEFSAGDKLFVQGSYNEGTYIFAGMLDYVSDGKFSGTIMTQTEWTGTTEELLSADGGAIATLLPAGYGEYGYLSIADEGTYEALLSENPNKAFATSKATAVEQFSWEDDNEYSSGFALIPVNAILNFTINGLDASTEVDVSFSYPNYPDPIVISGKVTTDGDGTATFAIGIIYGNNLKDCTLTVDGNAIALPDKEVEAGHIYNISRSVAPIISLTGRTYLDEELVIADGYIVTGSATNFSCKVAVADGATVTLRDVVNDNWSLNPSSACPGIRCIGDATIILEGNNTVKGSGMYAGIYVPEDKTLTIRGTGALTVTGGSGGAGIGGNETDDANCGSIVISGGTITATGGFHGAGIGLGYSPGRVFGDITISGGTVTATGGDGAPGIGGLNAYFQNITITNDVTQVTVNKGSGSTYSIGTSESDDMEYCGAITIGGTVYLNEGYFENDGDSYLRTSPLVYQP